MLVTGVSHEYWEIHYSGEIHLQTCDGLLRSSGHAIWALHVRSESRGRRALQNSCLSSECLGTAYHYGGVSKPYPEVDRCHSIILTASSRSASFSAQSPSVWR
ncbi:hypothetical protein GY45DRAFT_685763 [Cubamyces sp. BRFM 1775]|nr:hypothetical protein GY45DRAFT_685763 [Cubamyces sp. BRFM 1775]